jgi:hypothetical protein
MDLYDLQKERALLKALIEDAHFVDTCAIRTLEQRITDIEKLIVDEVKHVLSDINNVDELDILRL